MAQWGAPCIAFLPDHIEARMHSPKPSETLKAKITAAEKNSADEIAVPYTAPPRSLLLRGGVRPKKSKNIFTVHTAANAAASNNSNASIKGQKKNG